MMRERLNHYIIRVPKDQAAFTYFQLEANEGLAFYSTLDQSLRENYRDIELFSPQSLTKELDNFLEYLKNEVTYSVILNELLEDGEEVVDKFSKGGKSTL